jgi:glycosyltransferase involved in cell wall biosynthesis
VSPFRLNWLNYRYIPWDGYGRFGMKLIQALVRAGINLSAYQVDVLYWPGWLRQLNGFDGSALSIALMPSYELRPSGGRLWNFTMYEGTGLEDRWIPPLKAYAERLLVPHQFLVDVFQAHGCTIPIHVIPGGIDPVEFPVTPKSPYESGRPYTFLALGDRGSRKGWDLVWQAFWKAFKDADDVRLLIKTRAGGLPMLSLSRTDRRLSIWREDIETMGTVYAMADCFAFPTRGEGWGMPCREFAATGKPTIVTRWSGVENGIDHWAIPINKYKMVSARLRGDGQWAFPDVNELTDHMRWCYDNRDAARQKGLAAAQWLREHQSWDHSAQHLIKLINEVY